jgi:hypothetical protein
VTTTGADATSFADDGLSADTSYAYRVRAVNEAGESSWSSTASALTALAPTVAVVRAESGDPLEDALVFLNAADGTLLTQARTDSDGTVSFRADEIEGTQVSISAAKELALGAETTEKAIVTAKAVSQNEVTLSMSPELSGPPEQVGKITVEVTSIPEDATDVQVRLPGFENPLTETYEGQADNSLSFGDVSVDQRSLDADGELTVLAYASKNGLPVAYGWRTDLKVRGGGSFSVDLASDPEAFQFSTNSLVSSAELLAYRDGTEYPLDNAGILEPDTTGTITAFAGLSLASGTKEAYVLRVGSGQTQEDNAFTFNQYSATVPDGDVSLDIPTLRISGVGKSGATVSWSSSGSAAVQVKHVTLVHLASSESWVLAVPAGGNTVSLPDLPQNIAGWLDTSDGQIVRVVDYVEHDDYTSYVRAGFEGRVKFSARASKSPFEDIPGEEIPQ